jgi:hypothetical protein
MQFYWPFKRFCSPLSHCLPVKLSGGSFPNCQQYKTYNNTINHLRGARYSLVSANHAYTPKHICNGIVSHTQNINICHRDLTLIFDRAEDGWNNLRKHQNPPPLRNKLPINTVSQTKRLWSSSTRPWTSWFIRRWSWKSVVTLNYCRVHKTTDSLYFSMSLEQVG